MRSTKRTIELLTGLIAIAALALPAPAATQNTDGSGPWTSGSTWDGGSVPPTSFNGNIVMEDTDSTDTDVVFDPATNDPNGPQTYNYANAWINPQGSLTVKSGTLMCKGLVCSFGGDLTVNGGTMYAGSWGNGRIYVDITGGVYEVGGVAYHDYTTTQTDGLMKVGGLEYQPGSHSEGHLFYGGVCQVEDPNEFTFFPTDASHPNWFIFEDDGTGILKIKTDITPATFYAGLIDDEIIKIDPTEPWVYGQEVIGQDTYATLQTFEPAAIPEPVTLLSLGLGMAGVCVRLRRRR